MIDKPKSTESKPESKPIVIKSAESNKSESKSTQINILKTLRSFSKNMANTFIADGKADINLLITWLAINGRINCMAQTNNAHNMTYKIVVEIEVTEDLIKDVML